MHRLFFLLLLFISCNKTDQWEMKQIRTARDPGSHCLHYHSLDQIHGIDIQIYQTNKQLMTYLQVRTQLITSCQDTQKTEIAFITSKETVHFLVDCHQGGQRLLLPKDAQNSLFALLKEHPTVTLQLQGHYEILQSDSFLKNFKKMDELSIKIPFHLPF